MSGPALGMFEVFGRTGPPILGASIFYPKNSMLQLDTFYEHTARQNATVAGLHLGPCWGSLQSSPTRYSFVAGRGREEREGKEERGREG